MQLRVTYLSDQSMTDAICSYNNIARPRWQSKLDLDHCYPTDLGPNILKTLSQWLGHGHLQRTESLTITVILVTQSDPSASAQHTNHFIWSARDRFVVFKLIYEFRSLGIQRNIQLLYGYDLSDLWVDFVSCSKYRRFLAMSWIYKPKEGEC